MEHRRQTRAHGKGEDDGDPNVARAIFLDRDGVLVHEDGLITSANDLRLIEGATEGLLGLQAAGFQLVVVTNQAVVARGLISEVQLEALHQEFQQNLEQAGVQLTAIYACPHHPHANLAEYRQTCSCRKPQAGMLFRAAEDLGLDLERSYMVGDRLSDISAGQKAGCCTVLCQSGAHRDAAIVSDEDLSQVQADKVLPDLFAASLWILERESGSELSHSSYSDRAQANSNVERASA